MPDSHLFTLQLHKSLKYESFAEVKCELNDDEIIRNILILNCVETFLNFLFGFKVYKKIKLTK